MNGIFQYLSGFKQGQTQPLLGIYLNCGFNGPSNKVLIDLNQCVMGIAIQPAARGPHAAG